MEEDVVVSPSSDDRGATATEYAILVGFIAVVIAASIALFGQALLAYYQHIVGAVGGYL
jgi:pilus assembly protein Flp/PilA